MRIISLLLLITIISSVTPAQTVVFINSGSRAYYGTVQELTINLDGTAEYCERRVNDTCQRVQRFTITPVEVKSIFLKARALNFFNLPSTMESANKADGSGIYVSIKELPVRNVDTSMEQTDHGRIRKIAHAVHVINIYPNEIKQLMEYVNSLIVSKGFRIRYDMNVSTQKKIVTKIVQ